MSSNLLRTLIASSVADCYKHDSMQQDENFGDTNDEIRRMRLSRLCAAAGGLQGVARRAVTNWQYLDQVLKRRPLKAKQNGDRSIAALGDPLARRIEEAHGLPAGWLDWPFDAVPYTAWVRLSAENRGFVQGGMLRAIEQRIGKVEMEDLSQKDDAQDEKESTDARVVTKSNTNGGISRHEIGPSLASALINKPVRGSAGNKRGRTKGNDG
jgi:hypothetical protein